MPFKYLILGFLSFFCWRLLPMPAPIQKQSGLSLNGSLKAMLLILRSVIFLKRCQKNGQYRFIEKPVGNEIKVANSLYQKYIGQFKKMYNQ